jgi:phage head maturation protease
MNKPFQIHLPITKIDEEQRTVWGVATSEAIDSQNDIVDYAASKAAFSDWLGNIREMHQPVAVGKAIDIQFDDETKQVLIGAKISESTDGENAWIKVKEGVLNGFSIGGNIKQISKEVAKDKNGNDTPVTRIVDYDLGETSLVDSPANPEALFVMVKSQKGGGLQRTEHMATEPELRKQLVPAWFMQFTPPMEKAQALYDKV